MRTQVYAALIATVAAAGVTSAEKKVADHKKTSEATIKADLTACYTGTAVDDYKKCHWDAASCFTDALMAKYPNCQKAFKHAKDGKKWVVDQPIAHCAYGPNGDEKTDNTIDAKTGLIINTKLSKVDEDKCTWTTAMCDDKDHMKDFTLCKKKFPLAATTVADGACYYGTKASDVTTACTWDLCSKDDATLTNPNCVKNKATFITLTEKVHKAAADCAFSGTCTWEICQATDNSKKWANCSSRCLKDPTTTGCFDSKVAKDNCLFGKTGCTYDICKGHDVEKDTVKAPKKPTMVSDWDEYYYGKKCSWVQTQKYRLTVPKDTRANWTSVTSHDKAALKTAEGKTKGLIATQGSASKGACKTPSGSSADKKTQTEACTTAKAATAANALDIKKIKSWVKTNKGWRNKEDLGWNKAEITATQGADTLAAAGTKLNKDALARVASSEKATKALSAAKAAAWAKKYTKAATDVACISADKAKAECVTLAAASADNADALARHTNDLAEQKLTAANIKNLYATSGSGSAEKSTQPWFKTWNTNAIIDAKTLAAAEALQKTNTDAHTKAVKKGDTTTAEKSKNFVLESYVTAGAAAIHTVVNQDKWHKAALAGDKTKKELEATLKADTASHVKAVSDEKTTCGTTTKEKAAKKCTTAKLWTKMHADFITDDNKAIAAIKATSNTKANDKGKETKAVAEADLTSLQKANTAADLQVSKTEALIKKDCTTKTDKADTACKGYATTLAADKLAAADTEKAVKAQQAYIKKHYGSATVGIIIGCVAGVLCIGGGAAWYIKHKKASDDGFADDVFTSFTQ